jgi:hypothetical protein
MTPWIESEWTLVRFLSNGDDPSRLAEEFMVALESLGARNLEMNLSVMNDYQFGAEPNRLTINAYGIHDRSWGHLEIAVLTDLTNGLGHLTEVRSRWTSGFGDVWFPGLPRVGAMLS